MNANSHELTQESRCECDCRNKSVVVPATLWHAMVEHLVRHSLYVEALEDENPNASQDAIHILELASHLAMVLTVENWEHEMGTSIVDEEGRRKFYKVGSRFICRPVVHHPKDQGANSS